MRYYEITITDDGGGEVFFQSLQNTRLTSLLPSGYANPAALQVEFDIIQYKYHTPEGNTASLVRIWGLGLPDIGSAQDLNGKNIAISAGMSQGLPLANPKEQGLIISGQIYQAFGNWLGTEMTVDMLVMVKAGTLRKPMNFPLSWHMGTPLSQALSNTFGVAFPSARQIINISSNLVLNHDEIGLYGTLTAFSQTVYWLSKSIITDPTYPGVSIVYDGTTVAAFDNSLPPQTKQINVQDMLGQPTWFQQNTISFPVVLRGDLDLGDIIHIPTTVFGIQQAAQSQFAGGSPLITQPAPAYRVQDKLTFTGDFYVNRLHHHGNFRQPDAASWNTTIEAYQVGTAPPEGSSSAI